MFGEREREIWGGDAATTNNRMELTAAIEALNALTRPCQVELHTDSNTSRAASPSGSRCGRRAAGAP